MLTLYRSRALSRPLAVLSLAAFVTVALVAAPRDAAARHRRHVAPRPESEESAESAPGSGLNAPYTEACVIEPTTGTIIFEKDSHKPWPTASLAKMMVMLIVAEKLQ